MRATFVARSMPAKGIYTFNFKTDKKISFIPGQFIELSVDSSFSHEPNKRWFTISSSPYDELISITTKLQVDGSLSKFKETLDNLKPGEPVHISQAMGDFVLPLDKAKPLLMVAGGIGITPYLSMLKDMENNPDHIFSELSLIYCVKDFAQAIDLSSYDDLFRHYELIERSDSLADKIISWQKNNQAGLIYLAGPEKMVESLAEQLDQGGVNSGSIVKDFFAGYTQGNQ